VHFNYGHQVSRMATRESGESASGLRGETGDNHRSREPHSFPGPHSSEENIRKNKLSYSYMVIGNSNDLASGTSLKLQGEPERQAAHLYSLPSLGFQSSEPMTLSFRLGKNDPPADLTNDLKKRAGSGHSSFLSRLSVTPYFSQEFARYNLSDNNDSTGANGREIEKRERSVFSASGGIFLGYQLNKRWTIQSGVSYSWSSSILDPYESFAVKDNNGNVQFKVNTISGYGYLSSSSAVAPGVGDSVMMDRVYSNLHYLTVPLIASYGISLKKFTLLAGAGVSFNLLTSATVGTRILGSPGDQLESVVAMHGLKKVNYGVLLKAELQYDINSNWGVSLIPCFKNALSPMNIRSDLATSPYNFGIGLGISHRF
ncbi:MAG: outer membrane beta-barrel protein, partial [Bacteroidota bacterium]|nr:outer membrane beta-barrel protein [Bacteroidota bacterium]